MSKGKPSRRSKVRIKFIHRAPKISYRLATQLDSTSVELVDLSETGFAFQINENDEITRVGDIVFVNFKQLNKNESTCFTARIKRFEQKEGKLIFAAEFISVAKTFQNKVAKWAKIYQRTGYFLIERRSPVSIAFRATMKPIEMLKLFYDELVWRIEVGRKQLPVLSLKNSEISTRNMLSSIDFNQI